MIRKNEFQLFQSILQECLQNQTTLEGFLENRNIFFIKRFLYFLDTQKTSFQLFTSIKNRLYEQLIRHEKNPSNLRNYAYHLLTHYYNQAQYIERANFFLREAYQLETPLFITH
ncbi:MAG: hypothetical protein EAZ55_14325 [Cytophagales bacterium]|nr:MAG: hypothetical protein EAZ55_14325 [Cytophagales bacterium]